MGIAALLYPHATTESAGAKPATHCEPNYAPDTLCHVRPSPTPGLPTLPRIDFRGSGKQNPAIDDRAIPALSWHVPGNAAAPTMQPRFATYHDAAEYLAVSVRTIRRLVSEGHLRAVGDGAGRRVVVASLVAHAAALEEQAANATQNAEPCNGSDRG
jgi:excisionase family DNA binding protein